MRLIDGLWRNRVIAKQGTCLDSEQDKAMRRIDSFFFLAELGKQAS